MVVGQAPRGCREPEVAVLGEDDVLHSRADLVVLLAVGEAVVHQHLHTITWLALIVSAIH